MTIPLSFPGRIAQGLIRFGVATIAIARLLGQRPSQSLLALSLVTSGCANRVQDVLQPLAVDPDRHEPCNHAGRHDAQAFGGSRQALFR